MKSIIKATAIILGSVIGAGFASGQEIKIFFTNYGILGLAGLILSVAVMVLVINLSLKLILRHNTNTYGEFVEEIFENKKVLSYTMQNVITFFLLASFLIMSIGFSTCLEQQFSIPRYIGGLIIAVLCYITFAGNIDRIIKINEYIMPVLICLIIFVGVSVFTNGDWQIAREVNLNFLFNSFIYASYNVIPLLPILLTLKDEFKDEKKINMITIVSFTLICIPAIAIYIITCSNNIGNAEILLVEVTKGWGIIGSAVFSLVILAAIYTSAICSGYGFVKNITKTEKQYKVGILVICVLAVLISNFSFANTIQVIYPMFGILSLVQIFYLIILAFNQKL